MSQYTFTSRYRSPQIPTKSSAKLKPGFDGRRPCDHQSDIMALASLLTIRRKQTGVNPKRIRLFGWLESQVHELDTKFIIIGELGPPSVISAAIDVERTGKPELSINSGQTIQLDLVDSFKK